MTPLTEDAQIQATNSGDKIRELYLQHPEIQPLFLEFLNELMKQHA